MLEAGVDLSSPFPAQYFTFTTLPYYIVFSASMSPPSLPLVPLSLPPLHLRLVGPRG